jgi:dihydrofolate synthase/folylpolyglutamate synthase
VDATRRTGPLPDLQVGLLGGHQAANAAVALALVDAVVEDAERNGIRLALDEGAIRRGFAAARWPGRLELLRTTPVGPVLLDGAHNPAGARALARALSELGMRHFPLVFGAMRGKRVAAVLRALAPLEPQPVFTRVEDPGALPPGALLARWRSIGSGGGTSPSPEAALHLAGELRTAPDQPVVVAGSLYLVGAVRGMLRAEEDA